MKKKGHSTPMLPILMLALACCGCGGDASRRAEKSGNGDEAGQQPVSGLIEDNDLAPQRLLAFACGEQEPYLAVFEPENDSVLLYDPDGGRHVLAQQTAASGARYGDDRHLLWSKGRDGILLEIDGQAREDCAPSGRQRVLTAAYQAGYHHRASGNEPGWHLLVGPQTIRLELQGLPAVSFEGLAQADFRPGATIRREAAGHTLLITVTDRLCRDSMSGEPSPLTVVLEFDGETLHGCGVGLR